jgi:hypothetical protein
MSAEGRPGIIIISGLRGRLGGRVAANPVTGDCEPETGLGLHEANRAAGEQIIAANTEICPPRGSLVLVKLPPKLRLPRYA